jgi:hypothetical protein
MAERLIESIEIQKWNSYSLCIIAINTAKSFSDTSVVSWLCCSVIGNIEGSGAPVDAINRNKMNKSAGDHSFAGEVYFEIWLIIWFICMIVDIFFYFY